MVRRLALLAAAVALVTLTGCSDDGPPETNAPAGETRPAPSADSADPQSWCELVYQIRPDEDGSAADADLARRMIEVLKRRVDSQRAGLEWRPLGNERFSVRMPTGKDAALDVDDLKRLIARTGTLEFRVAPAEPRAAPEFMPISREDYDLYLTELRDEGPDAADRRNARLQWFPVRGRGDTYSGMVTARHGEDLYMLLCTEAGDTMRHHGDRWSLKRAYVTADNMGQPAVGFEFDREGAAKLAALTEAHKGHFLAVLLDGVVHSCPIVREKIGGRGVITGQFTRAEVTELARVLEAGALPARLVPQPVSETHVGPRK